MGQSNNRTWIGGTIFIIIILALVGYFLLIKPVQDETARVEEEIDTVAAQNRVLRIHVNQLRAQEQGLPEVRAEIAQLQVGLPAEERVDEFIDMVEELAIEHDVFVALISSSPATPPEYYEPPGFMQPDEPEVSDDADSDGPPRPNTEEEEDENTSSEQQPTLTEVPGLFSIPFGVEVSGLPANVSAFLNSLQLELPRHFLLVQLNLDVVEKGEPERDGRPALDIGYVITEITGSLYVLDPPEDTQLVAEEDQVSVEPQPLPTPDANRNPYQPYGGTGGSGGGGTSAGDDD